jgi:DNA polymerase V
VQTQALTPPLHVKQLALVDCNNFYVSCERVFRPDLIHTPVVALSNNDGCVISRSNEAKALGVKMGQPWFEVKELEREHGVLALSSNYALYADMSNRVMSILSQFTPTQEVYSIDESFLDLSGIRELRDVSYKIKQTVGQWTGIPVCVGIGPTKTLAKLANQVAKKHPKSKGVFNFNDLNESQKDALLSKIEVSQVWGVGRRLTNRLNAYKVYTVQDLKLADTPTLRAEFGVVMEKTQRELRELSCIDMTQVEPAKKQIVCSRSFGQMITDVNALKDAVSLFVSNACQKLRAQQSHACIIQVFLSTNRFRAELPQYNPCISVPLPQPTNDTVYVNTWANYLVEKMFKSGYSYKKAGVMLSEITPTTHMQMDMWEPAHQPNERLMGALDELNKRYGRGTVTVSTQGTYLDKQSGQNWHMKQTRKSPNYTTNWHEVPYV